MNIYVNKLTRRVDLSSSPFTCEIKIPNNFSVSKSIKVLDGEVQKVNEMGQLLYKINIQEDDSFEETTESRTVIKTIEKEVTNKWEDEDGEHSETIMVKEPLEQRDNEPLMIPNIITRTITFDDDPTQFTLDDIIYAKYSNLLDYSISDHIVASMFLVEDDLDLEDEKHLANTGIMIAELLPYGQIKTKAIILEKPTSKIDVLELDIDDGIDVYISDHKIDGNKIVFQNPVSSCVIKFVNTTDEYKSVRSYALAY